MRDRMAVLSRIGAVTVTFATALLSGLVLRATDGFVPAKAIGVAIACAAVVAGLLLSPDDRDDTATWPRVALTVLLWSAAVGGASAAAWFALATPSARAALALAGAVAVLTFFLTGLCRCLTTRAERADGARLAILLVLLLAGMAPIWLGPWVEALGDHAVVNNAVVAFNPLTYLAMVVDLDVLRTEWFYAWSPFGGLRYTYPNSTIVATVLVLAGTAAHGFGRKQRHPPS
jgi:hypothetical protein